MVAKELCRYYAPCGWCTRVDKPCDEVCNQKTEDMRGGGVKGLIDKLGQAKHDSVLSEIEKYGISVRDENGEFRDTVDVLEDIKNAIERTYGTL